MVAGKMNRTAAARHVAGQLVSSATSAGANYEEACGAESRADFIHKMQVVLKELRESLYWLRLVKRSNRVSPSLAEPPLREADELARIVGRSVITAKKA